MNLIGRYHSVSGPEDLTPRWEQDYHLQAMSKLGLFYEYLEMSKSFVTLKGPYSTCHWAQGSCPSHGTPDLPVRGPCASVCVVQAQGLSTVQRCRAPWGAASPRTLSAGVRVNSAVRPQAQPGPPRAHSPRCWPLPFCTESILRACRVPAPPRGSLLFRWAACFCLRLTPCTGDHSSGSKSQHGALAPERSVLGVSPGAVFFR